MVAAKDNSLDDSGTPDLSLDSLPDESADEARETAAKRVELPQKMDADQLHKNQTAKLQIPGPANVAKTAPTQQQQTAAQPAPVPVNPADAPVPVTQQPQLNPVHPPIGNPYDILNR